MKVFMFYKYVGAETALKIITGGQLMFTAPDRFNDPYDTYGKSPKTGYSKYVKRVCRERGASVSFSTRKRSDAFTRFDIDSFRRDVASQFSVTCFSKSPYILPMWAHYADNHRGCVLGFTAGKDEEDSINKSRRAGKSFSTDLLYPLEVIYSDRRPAFYDEDGHTNTDSGFQTFLTKAKSWEYEQELRSIQLKPSGLFNYRRSQLTHVYYGLKMTEADKDSIKKSLIINRDTYGHRVRIEQIIMHRDTYELQNL